MSPVPRVSVVVPAYNRQATIMRAIDSILTQDFSDFELIVADDGSTDGTRELVRGIADSRIRLLERGVNGGAAAARNSGVLAARAPYIAFLDSDDRFLPGKLSIQYAALTSAPATVRLSCTAYRIELIDQNRIIDSIHTPAMGQFGGLYNGCSLGPGSTLMCARKVFDDIGIFDTTLSRFEDWEWLIRYAATGGEILLVNEILSYVYNRRGRLARQTYEAAEGFIAKRDRLYPQIPLAQRRQSDFSIWSQVAGTGYYAGDKSIFALASWRALRASPSAVAKSATRFLLGRSAQSVSGTSPER